MADYLIYWKNYRRDRSPDRYVTQLGRDNPLADWRTNASWLFGKFQSGDRFWFVTAGNLCGGTVSTAAYLVNVFTAKEMVENSGDDPNYPRDEFRYTINASEDSVRWIDPPILVDEWVRPEGHAVDEHIGGLLQGPRTLPPHKISVFENLLSAV